ncbi:calcium/sodium antiporter [Fulvivirga sediminis]|uniref:Calcium/sodium antiporter n=1 Tax=Fulvivirga sediminis TaxID=2803949 RepID=A0A937F9A7_9BACT|nr:calcium/sodium antiporter [Fulvivirga sediminis]MBL3656984.1 calcium/sodium antiporter [Fulvivirga sediminis]
MLSEISVLIVGLIILIVGGDLLVRGASSIALRSHISPLVVGLTIVAFGTSAPELLISIKAALGGSPDMTMGNVVGSNICNLGLVLGITAMIAPIMVRPDSIRIDWPVTMGSSLLLYYVVKEDVSMIKAYEGAIFILFLVIYTVFIIRKSRKETKAKISKSEGLDIPKASKSLWKDVLLILAGCLGLYFGSEWFVGGAKEMAGFLGVSERVIGITVLALGTSLPELVTAIVASLKKQTDLALGNLMGSNIFNILSILGITSIIKNIHVSDQIIHHDMVAMLLLTLILFPLMIYKRVVGRIAGAFLLCLYLVYTYTVII